MVVNLSKMSKTLSNNENNLQIGPHLNKNGGTIRKHPIKKVFGEIKNVIHNQGMSTPVKSDAVISNKQIATKPMRVNVLRMSVADNDSKLCSTATICSDNLDQIQLLDYFDFRGECCSNPCKSDEQIWAEINLYDDSFLSKLTKDETQLDDEPKWDISNYDNDSDDDILDDLKDGFNLYYCPNVETNNSNCNEDCFCCKPMY